MIDGQLVRQIQDVLKTQPRVVAAYVLGSFTKGTAAKESDFDLAVVVEDKRQVADTQIYNLISHLNFPKDLDLSVVDKTSSPLFLFQAIGGGGRIYERSRNDTVRFEAYVLKNYYDTAHMRKIYYSYLKHKFPLKSYVNR